MFPSRKACPNGALKFKDIGIVTIDNISIAWPKKIHDRKSPPLADIVERQEERDDGYVQWLEVVHTSTYTSAYSILQPNTLYTIVAASWYLYRGAYHWHFQTECGIRVRAGKSLETLWNKWRSNFEEDAVEYMEFRAVRKVTTRGKDDMKCVMP